MSGESQSKRWLYVLLVVALLAIAIMGYFLISQNSSAGLSEEQQAVVEQIAHENQEIEGEFSSLIEELEAAMAASKKGSITRKTTSELVGTLKLYRNQVKLSGVFTVIDTADIAQYKRQLEMAREWLLHAKRLISENDQILRKLNVIGKYELRIDSLKSELAALESSRTADAGRIASLRGEISRYEGKIQELLEGNENLQRTNDSLASNLFKNSSLIDSLKRQLQQKELAYNELNSKARKDAELVTQVNLWYFEKDNMRKARRRLLTNDQDDYNRGSEIKTISGEFTLSQFDFSPFEIGTVYLIQMNNSAEHELARVKVSVRDQRSAEFSLIPSEKLDKGKYEVRVEYKGKVIITKNFYVAQ